MQVIGAYILVVLIWSTTPLAIHWSNSSLSFSAAIGIRMIMGAALCYLLLRLLRQRLIHSAQDWRIYGVSALGLFPNMLLVYWAAQHIPSGLMSVIMGVYPFCVGIFSWWLLRDNPFNAARLCALLMAVAGLAIIHHEQAALGRESVLGVLAMVAVCVIWGFSSVILKKLGGHIGPVRQASGSLAVAWPFFALTWWVLDGTPPAPESLDGRSVAGVLYLVLAGSVIGHTLWFYVLRECSVISVSLITLMTPVLAITWGVLLAGESLAATTLAGAGMIVLALALYQGVMVRVLQIAARALRSLVRHGR